MAVTDEVKVDFETALKRDLPRGMTRKAQAYGQERGLTSRWLTPDEMVGETWNHTDGLMLGMRNGRIIGWNDNRHMLTIAGSRAGKGVSMIIPNLIFYEGSAVVVDPKGENAARTARQRGKGPLAGGEGLNQAVYVLDPFGESGLPTDSFNPLQSLKANDPDVVEDISLFADALITHDAKGERHWTEAAQALLQALILVVVGDPAFLERRNLITVRRLLTLTDPFLAIVQKRTKEQTGEEIKTEDALIQLLHDQTGGKFVHICNGMAEQLQAMGDKERGSVLSTARTQTQWLDSPKMPAVLEQTTAEFDLANLKKKQMSLYLCLPATRMSTHSRWLRLMVLLSIGIMEREKTKPKLPVLFVLDEFPVLGYMQSVETAAGLMAGFGVKLWPIVQNIGQLKQHYEKSWETFVANAGVVTAFGVSDTETLTALSDLLGQTGIMGKVDTGASDSSLHQGGASQHDKPENLPLLAKHELRMAFGRKKNRVLIFNVEDNPAVAERFEYHQKGSMFDGHYDPDPNYVSKP